MTLAEKGILAVLLDEPQITPAGPLYRISPDTERLQSDLFCFIRKNKSFDIVGQRSQYKWLHLFIIKQTCKTLSHLPFKCDLIKSF